MSSQESTARDKIMKMMDEIDEKVEQKWLSEYDITDILKRNKKD